MAALNANDPLSRLIGVDTAQPSELVSKSAEPANGMEGDAVLHMNAVGEADSSATAHNRDRIDTLASAASPARRPLRSKRPKRSAAHPQGAGRGEAPSNSVAGYGSNVRGVDPDPQSPAVSATDASTREAVLEELMPALESARAFANRWEAPYQPEIFRVAVGALLGHTAGLAGGSQGHGTSTDQRSSGVHTSYQTTQRSADAHATGGGLGPTGKLARTLGVNAEDVERVVMLGDDNRITIIGHAEGKTKKQLQTKYGLAYCFVKEVALGNPLVDIEELRDLCVEHGCYDLANFTGNFRKDVKSGLLREIGAKGSRARQYRLAKKGLDEASLLLREMVDQ